MARVVVVGAGVAGLTVADRLVHDGHQVVVLERSPGVGGLARSFRYDDFVFDVGPHRFHTHDERVRAYILDVLGDDVRTIGRRSAVWMFGRRFSWPLSASAARGLPPRVLARVARDMLTRRPPDGDSFEDHIRSRYGDTLYQVFFKPYTERFTGTAPHLLDRAWATTSLQRALIDRRIRAGSLLTMLASRRRPLQFLYPRSGGVGRFSERLAERVVAAGAELRLGAAVDGMHVEQDRVVEVTAGGRTEPCDRVIWAAPITVAGGLLGVPVPTLQFLSLLLFNVRVAGPARTADQWCYYSDDAVPFSRVSVPTLFNPALAPAGSHGLCVELPMPAEDPRQHDPAALTAGVCRGLERVGLVASRRDILGVDIERVSHAYPLYTLGFQATLTQVRAGLSAYGNLHLLGRSGTFDYNNMDGSIGAALALADGIRTS